MEEIVEMEALGEEGMRNIRGGGESESESDLDNDLDLDDTSPLVVRNNIVLLLLIVIILTTGAVCSYIIFNLINDQAREKSNSTLAHSCATLSNVILLSLNSVSAAHLDSNRRLNYNIDTLTQQQYYDANRREVFPVSVFMSILGASPRTFDTDRNRTEVWGVDQYQSEFSFLDYDYFQKTYMPSEERSVYLPYLYTNRNPPNVTFGPQLGSDLLNHSAVPNTIISAVQRGLPTISSGVCDVRRMCGWFRGALCCA